MCQGDNIPTKEQKKNKATSGSRILAPGGGLKLAH